MKKYIKTIIVVVLLAGLGLGYYYYLSNRTPSKDATEQSIANEQVAALTTRDIENNYPQSPKEVVKLYAKITKAYYETKLSDEQIEQLGTQARFLFDDELKASQTDEQFLNALKEDISSYHSVNRYISDYKLQTSNEVKHQTLNGREYSSLIALYYIREGSNLTHSYTRFVLRQDTDGRWKILYWELVSDSELRDDE